MLLNRTIFMCLYICLFLTCNSQSFVDIETEKLHEQYGICGHFASHYTPSEWLRNDSIFSIIEDLGIDYLRTDFNWHVVQPNIHSQFMTGHIDTLLHCLNSHNIKILPILDYSIPDCNPAWKHQEAWNNYCLNVINQYSDNISYVEIWNEENNDEFWSSPSALKYSDFFLKTFAFFKEKMPDKLLINGGLAGYDYNYMNGLLKNGLFDKSHVVAIHYSSGARPPEYIFELEKHRKELFGKYAVDIPVWFTETSYSTGVAQDFFDIYIPTICNVLSVPMDKNTIGLLFDSESSFVGSTILENSLRGFKSIQKIDCCDLYELDPKDVPIIIPSVDESYPIKYIDGLIEYIRKGGSVVSLHGLPFYYDSSNYNGETTAYRTRTKDLDILYKKLHIDYVFNDNPLANVYDLDFVPSRCEATNTDMVNFKTEALKSSRFLLSRNMLNGDSLIPLIYATDGSRKGIVSAIYNLNSDLKGNIVLFTNLDFYPPISEEIKSERLPRLFLCAFALGVEKVFLYEILSKEKDIANKEHHFGILNEDLTPKPSFTSYKTLIRMCPNESTRPKLEFKDGVYKADWIKPDGKHVVALWSISNGKRNPYRLHPRKTYNQFGIPLKWDSIRSCIGSSVIYLEM